MVYIDCCLFYNLLVKFFKVDSNLKFLCSEIRIEEKFISIYIFDSTSEHFQILSSHERFWSKTSFNIQCHISWINVVITFLYFFSFWNLPVCLYLWAYLLFCIYIEILIHISTSFEIGTVISNVMGYFIFLELRHFVNMFQYLLLLSDYTFNFLSFGMCWQLSSLSTISKDWKEFTHLKHQSPSEHESSLVQRSRRLVHNLSPTINVACTFTQHTNFVINWIRETFYA